MALNERDPSTRRHQFPDAMPIRVSTAELIA
jgi:hypothetical protein